MKDKEFKKLFTINKNIYDKKEKKKKAMSRKEVKRILEGKQKDDTGITLLKILIITALIIHILQSLK